MKTYFKIIDTLFGLVVFGVIIYCAGICGSLDLDVIALSEVFNWTTFIVIVMFPLAFLIENTKAHTWSLFSTLFMSICLFIANRKHKLSRDERALRRYRKKFSSNSEFFWSTYYNMLAVSIKEADSDI